MPQYLRKSRWVIILRYPSCTLIPTVFLPHGLKAWLECSRQPVVVCGPGPFHQGAQTPGRSECRQHCPHTISQTFLQPFLAIHIIPHLQFPDIWTGEMQGKPVSLAP
jgi:hypothetical protein